MQAMEVTQAQWNVVMDTTPWKGQRFVREGANYPAVCVSWDDTIAFCKKLSEKEGKTYRLPTEAEWEYACRAVTETAWSFGDDKKKIGDYACFGAKAWTSLKRYAQQVGLKKPNAFGLYDMHGNVWEWCHDYFSKDYYRQSPEKDPTGPVSGSLRVLRGGAWSDASRFSRSACRGRNDAAYRSVSIGFRLVCELD
jgi:formylglycine-generating enzyme required for sulfatase activity